jgi:hypothetical protein
MAYLRKEKETVEIDYPLSKVWETFPKTLASLEWTIQEIDQERHQLKVKTRSGFMLFSSTLLIDAIETPVTTITAMMEFGRARERLDLFFETLAKHLAQ